MPPARPSIVRGHLLVVEGPDRGRSCALGDAEIVVGSHIDCDLVLSDDRVSGRHLGVRAHGGGFVVRDLGSRNGTWSGPTRITETTVPSGATVTIASTTLRLEPETDRIEARPPAQLELRDDLPYDEARAAMLEAFERRYLGAVLARHAGSEAAAARASGLPRARLRELVRKHGLLSRADDD